jgi:hypothetical protein
LSSGVDVGSILNDIASIRKHQTAISAELKELQSSSQQLWRESMLSRERHQRHQDTINKIMRFLAGVFGGKVLSEGDGNIGEVEDLEVGLGDDGTGEGIRPGDVKRIIVPGPRKRLFIEDAKADHWDKPDGRLKEVELPDETIEEIRPSES